MGSPPDLGTYCNGSRNIGAVVVLAGRVPVTGWSRLVVNEKVASYGERIHVYTVYPYSGYPDRHAPSGLLV